MGAKEVKKMKPYIGITDFTCAEQALQMLQARRMASALLDEGVELPRIGVGVMTTWSILRRAPSKYSQVFPALHELADIFGNDHPDLFNVLHVADYKKRTELSDLRRAALAGGLHLHALQLDMPWPAPGMIRMFRNEHPQTQLILQVGEQALAMVGHDLRHMVRMLQSYGQALDYVLLDMSAGQGILLDEHRLWPMIEIIREHLPHLDLVVAGGLGPETIDRVQGIIAADPRISIDAQANLRPSGSLMDPIDWDMASQYVQRAAFHYGYSQEDHLAHLH